MRVACVLVTHLRAKVEMSRQSHLKDCPFLVVDRDPSGTGDVVVDRFPGASGVTNGMAIVEAVARRANAVVLDADEPRYRRVFGQVLASLQGASERVEAAGLGTVYVRLDGLEGLYRGEAGLVSALLNSVPGYLHPRVGIADAKFPAFVAARTCSGHGAFRVPKDAAAFLAPRSIDLLPVPGDLNRELYRFGLHTMGGVASKHGPTGDTGHVLGRRVRDVEGSTGAVVYRAMSCSLQSGTCAVMSALKSFPWLGTRRCSNSWAITKSWNSTS